MTAQTVTTFQAFKATLKRDLLIAYKRKNDMVNPFMFFLIVASLFPIGISPDPDRLAEIASGVLWISALLASLLAMDNLFRGGFSGGLRPSGPPRIPSGAKIGYSGGIPK